MGRTVAMVPVQLQVGVRHRLPTAIRMALFAMTMQMTAFSVPGAGLIKDVVIRHNPY